MPWVWWLTKLNFDGATCSDHCGGGAAPDAAPTLCRSRRHAAGAPLPMAARARRGGAALCCAACLLSGVPTAHPSLNETRGAARGAAAAGVRRGGVSDATQTDAAVLCCVVLCVTSCSHAPWGASSVRTTKARLRGRRQAKGCRTRPLLAPPPPVKMASMLKKLVPKMAAGARNASTLRKVRFRRRGRMRPHAKDGRATHRALSVIRTADARAHPPPRCAGVRHRRCRRHRPAAGPADEDGARAPRRCAAPLHGTFLVSLARARLWPHMRAGCACPAAWLCTWQRQRGRARGAPRPRAQGGGGATPRGGKRAVRPAAPPSGALRADAPPLRVAARRTPRWATCRCST
jgi:hypothetical protein